MSDNSDEEEKQGPGGSGMHNQANYVSIKPPSFSDTAADGWFGVMEAQFSIAKITSEQTKFFHAVAALPPEVYRNLPNDVKTDQSFMELKDAVISSYEATRPQLFTQLIERKTITGRPSVYLQEMLAIAHKIGVSEDFVRHKFLDSAPNTIYPVLASQKSLTLQQLGTLADELIPSMNTRAGSINTVENSEFKRQSHHFPSEGDQV